MGDEPSTQVVAPCLQEHPTPALSRQEELPEEGRNMRDRLCSGRGVTVVMCVSVCLLSPFLCVSSHLSVYLYLFIMFV